MPPRARAPQWMPLQQAISSPRVSTADKIAIAAALIEEEALRRAAVLFAGPDGAAAWYVGHGGRFRFSEDGEHLMIQVPVPPFGLGAA